jgi:hypothetical protein
MAKNWNSFADLPENQKIRDTAANLSGLEYLSRTGISRNWEIQSTYMRFICKSPKVFATEAEAWAEWWTPERKDYYRLTR